MKTQSFLSATLVASLMIAAPTFAQMTPSWDYNPTLDRNGPPVMMDHRSSPPPPPIMSELRNRNDSIQRGYGPRGDQYIGERLHRDYRGQRYVIKNWQYYRLTAPPRGARWVRVGDDYLLVAIANNIILQAGGR